VAFFTKAKQRLAAQASVLGTMLRNDRSKRADILLAHRVAARRRPPTLRQWHLVGRVLTPSELRFIRIAFYSIFAGVLLIFGRWLLMHAELIPAAGGEYREGMVGKARAVNPVIAGSNDVDLTLSRLVFNGLYRRDANAQLVTDLAGSVEISPDGKTYTITLKPDIKFHDNQPLTADDVVFTVNIILDPAWKSPLAKGLQGITVAARDPQTVVFSANQPPAYLPSLLTFGILPKHIWSNVSPATSSTVAWNLKPIGSGPYKFEKLSRDGSGNVTSYTLHSVPGSGAMLDRIIFKFYDDYGSAADALTGNAVDGLNFAPPAERASIKTIPGIVLNAPSLAQYTALFLNPKKDTALANINIRQALALAIDRDRIVKEALNGLGEVRDAPLSAVTAGITRYDYDQATAGALLDKAGYALDQTTKIRTKAETTPPKTKKDQPVVTTTELSVTITTIDSDENRRTAEIIKEGWTALGVKTDIITAPAASINTSVIRPREYDALLFGEVLPPESDPFPFWHSSQITSGLNLAMYSNRRVDELLEKARVAPSTAERDQFLSEFQKIVTAEAPAIFLYQPDYLYPQSSKIKGFSVHKIASPADRFVNVTEWYRKLKVAFK
jgi:peptide/nickel transport system substrate-binding protein